MHKIIKNLTVILSLPATILIASIILGGFYFVSQVIKQKSIEKQQEIKRMQECYDKERYNAEYYYDKEDQICKIKNSKRETLEEIFNKQ